MDEQGGEQPCDDGPALTITLPRKTFQLIEVWTIFVWTVVNRRSSEIQGTALGKCPQAWPVYRSRPAGVAFGEPVWPSGKALGW